MPKRRIKVKSLIEDEPIEWPTCDHLLSREVRQFWHGRARPGQDGGDYCGRFAKYRIGGKHYCRMHAGMVALRLAIEAGGIQKGTS